MMWYIVGLFFFFVLFANLRKAFYKGKKDLDLGDEETIHWDSLEDFYRYS